MDLKIFGSLGTYGQIYFYLVNGAKTKEEVQKYLKENCSRKTTTIGEHVKKAANGDLPYISFVNERLVLDMAGIREFLKEFASELQYDIPIEPKQAESKRKKKKQPEDEVTVITDSHSPQYIQQMNEANSAKSKVGSLESEITKKNEAIARLQNLVDAKIDEVLLKFMGEKVLVVKDVKVKPETHFQRDFFLCDSESLLDVDDLVEKYAKEIDSPYMTVFSVEKNLTTEKYANHIWNRLPITRIFQRRCEEQDRLPAVTTPEADDGWVKRDSINRVEIEKNRLQSVNAILAMGGEVTNQMKLSLYAAWFDGTDPEMAELLHYAGEHDINANYVIHLLEKPKEYRNYRTMRGLLQQAKMASEAHIKREAAVELISGDWYMEATYKGKPCQFKMMPVTELLEFMELLKKQQSGEALILLEQLLEEKRKASFKEKNPNGEVIVTTAGKGVDTQKKDIQIATPAFLHEREKESGVNCHPDIDEDEALEGFSEAEEKKEGGSDGKVKGKK